MLLISNVNALSSKMPLEVAELLQHINISPSMALREVPVLSLLSR